MFKTTLLKHFMPIALSVSMVVQSLPATALAAEQNETVIEETVVSEETVEAAETTSSTNAEESEPVQETTQAAAETTPSTEGETPDNSSSDDEVSDEETTTTEASTVEETATESSTAEETTTEASAAEETATVEASETEASAAEETATEVSTAEETATETEAAEETTIVETEEETTEVTTEEETTEEITDEEIDNADENAAALGNEHIKLSNVKAAYNSISFDYTEKNSNIRYIIISDQEGNAKASSSKYLSYNNNSGSVTLGGLTPATKYYIYFSEGSWYNSSEVYYEFSETTAECPYEVKYDLTSPSAESIKLTAAIKAKEGAEYQLPEQFQLHWIAYNAEGESVSEAYQPVSASSLPAEITTDISFEKKYMFGSTEYTFETWISEPWEYDYSYGSKQTQFGRESGKKVTTAASVVSEVNFSYEQNASVKSQVDYTFTTGSYTENAYPAMFYRLKGSNAEWDESYPSYTENGSYTGSISELSIGAAYEYLINAAGFKKEGEFKNGEADLKWNISHDVGALDDVITFVIDDSTKTAGAEYSAVVSYKRHASKWWDDEIYTDEENPTTYIVGNLRPNTEYDISFDIVEELANGKVNHYTALETVTTKASAIKLDSIYRYIDGVYIDVAFDSSIRTENLDSWDGIEVYPYIKNEDGKYTELDGYAGLRKYSGYCYISGLESNKTYEVSLGYLNEEDGTYYEYGTISFKTQADDRSITVNAVQAGVSSAAIKGERKGNARSINGSGIIMFYKESGSEKWLNTEADMDYDEATETELNTFTAYLYGESGKSYDYVIGIGSAKLGVDKLKSAKKGTVTINADERSVKLTDTVMLLDDAVVVKAELSGKYIDNYNTAYMLYREKGSDGWDQTFLSFDEGSRKTSRLIEGLKNGTTYEYKVCMKLPEKVEDYAGLAGGEFTYAAPADDRTLTLNGEVMTKRTSAKIEAALAGSSRARENCVTLFMRKTGDANASWSRRSYIISWNASRQTVSFNVTGLDSDTEYEYLIGISNSSISSDSQILEGKKLEGKFTTLTDGKRFVGEPVITSDYASATLEVEVEGIEDDSARIYFYTKDATAQNASWHCEEDTTVFNNNDRAKFTKTLGQGETYYYAFVIADNSSYGPDSENYSKLSPDKKRDNATFTAKSSKYTLKLEDTDKSVYNKAVLKLSIEATEFDEKNFKAYLQVREEETGDSVYLSNNSVSLNSTDKTAEMVIPNLDENTKYVVTAFLYAYVVKENNLQPQLVATLSGDSEFKFTTKAAAAPTELTADVEELYLNSWNMSYNYDDYHRRTVKITVPEGASNKVTSSSSNTNVAEVYGTTVYAVNPGEATITIASALDSSKRAEIKVHVKNYGVIYTDKKMASEYNSVGTRKNKKSDNIVYAEIADDGKAYAQVKATGASENPNIAYWDEAEQCIVSKNAGKTYITLNAEGYKTDLYVVVYANSPDLSVKVSPRENDDSDAEYPALKRGEEYQIAIGSNYWLDIEANPEILDYDLTEVLKVTSSDTKILEVNGSSVRGRQKGKATVTIAYDIEKIKQLADQSSYDSAIKALAESADLADKTKTITFDVRPLYTQGLPKVHAITNIAKTLGDVALPGEGWTWRDPKTPLYTLPTDGNASYRFEAKYEGMEYYNYEGDVEVAISTVVGAVVTNNGSNVISADGKDAMSLIVEPVIYGADLTENTDYKVIIPDDVQGVKVAEDESGYKITADKKGKYTLKFKLQTMEGTDLDAEGSYTFTAVEGKLIDRIVLTADAENESVRIDGDKIYFDVKAGVDKFNLKAAAIDREGNEAADTKLTWTITDKTVAAIKANDRNAEIAIKGEGHAVIQVTAGDAAKASARYVLQVRNYKPRVEGDKLTVNTAYDYTTPNGRTLSANQYGSISVTAVYDDGIADVQVVDGAVEDGETNVKASESFEAVAIKTVDIGEKEKEKYYVIKPKNPDMAAGKNSVSLVVTTDSGFNYAYPLAVTVIKKEPKVTAKISKTMNLFYLGDAGQLDITLEKNKSKGTDFSIQNVTWSAGAGNGFKFSREGWLEKTPNVIRYSIDGSKVKVDSKGKVDQSVASGTASVKLMGVREAVKVPVTVKYTYKKPKLTTVDYMTAKFSDKGDVTGKNTSVIIPDINGKSGIFYICADKKLLYYSSSYDTSLDQAYYNERKCGNADVAVSGSSYTKFSYNGEAAQFDIPLTIDSNNWREALTVTHKVKAVKATAVLQYPKLTLNTKYDSEVRTSIYIKDYYAYDVITAVDVAGADQASQELLTSNKLQVEYNTDDGRLHVKLKEGAVPADTKKAAYVLKPYYYDSVADEYKALNNTLKLNITFTDKNVEAKISGKGKLDPTVYDNFGYSNYAEYFKGMTNNHIAVTPKFANLGTGYYVVGARLTGEYSQYFTFNPGSDKNYIKNNIYYIGISDKGRGSIKAGQTYNLSVTYTLEDWFGNRITVGSNALKVKPTQKAPKLTVSGDNKPLYAALPKLSRVCYITIPASMSEYQIMSASGFIDTNKDGKADITVSLDEGGYNRATLRIRLEDEDAVVAAAKGKAYTIPVTVGMKGRDGISKDAVVNVKVTVKR